VLMCVCVYVNTVGDLSAYVRSGPPGSSPARTAPRVATASVSSTRGAAQRTNPLSAFDTRDVSLLS